MIATKFGTTSIIIIIYPRISKLFLLLLIENSYSYIG
jgi:hypothetical protein